MVWQREPREASYLRPSSSKSRLSPPSTVLNTAKILSKLIRKMSVGFFPPFLKWDVQTGMWSSLEVLEGKYLMHQLWKKTGLQHDHRRFLVWLLKSGRSKGVFLLKPLAKIIENNQKTKNFSQYQTLTPHKNNNFRESFHYFACWRQDKRGYFLRKHLWMLWLIFIEIWIIKSPGEQDWAYKLNIITLKLSTNGLLCSKTIKRRNKESW